MAKPSLQLKNVASLLLAASASAASGVAWRRFDSGPVTRWLVPMLILAGCLACQLGLVFVESKEEEELSLARQRRMDAERQQMQINATLASKMDEALQADDLKRYTRLKALRKD